jgi:cytidine deaminase
VRYPKPEEEDQTIAVVTPCGACREMLADYDPDALVIVPGPFKVLSRQLLPWPYRR